MVRGGKLFHTRAVATVNVQSPSKFINIVAYNNARFQQLIDGLIVVMAINNNLQCSILGQVISRKSSSTLYLSLLLSTNTCF